MGLGREKEKGSLSLALLIRQDTRHPPISSPKHETGRFKCDTRQKQDEERKKNARKIEIRDLKNLAFYLVIFR